MTDYIDYPDSYQNELIEKTIKEFFIEYNFDTAPVKHWVRDFLDHLAESSLKIGYPPDYPTNIVDDKEST